MHTRLWKLELVYPALVLRPAEFSLMPSSTHSPWGPQFELSALGEESIMKPFRLIEPV
jgi:hypothetical protein